MDNNRLLIIALFILVVCVAAGLWYVHLRNRSVVSGQAWDEEDEDGDYIDQDYTQNDDIMSKNNKHKHNRSSGHHRGGNAKGKDERAYRNGGASVYSSEYDRNQSGDSDPRSREVSDTSSRANSSTSSSPNSSTDSRDGSNVNANASSNEQRPTSSTYERSSSGTTQNRYTGSSYGDSYNRSNGGYNDEDYYDSYSQGYSQREATSSANANTVDESRPSTVAIIYRSEIDYISRCIHDYPDIETGGQLFGFLTENGSPVVCYAIGPGPHANHQSMFFNQDTRYLQDVFDEVNARWGLRYIGEWHSHHQLGLAKPSGHDARTIVRGMQRSNFRHFLLCIGNCDARYHSTLNAFTFHLNNPYNYHYAPWKIIERESPYRAEIDHELRDMLEHPEFPQASHGPLYTVGQSGKQAVVIPDYSAEYWLNNKANNLVLKEILDFLKAEEPNSTVRPMLDQKKHVHLIVERPRRKEHIIFGEYFPESAPVILNQADESLKDEEGWNYSGDILKAFIRYYRGALRSEQKILESRKQQAMRVVSDRIKPSSPSESTSTSNDDEPSPEAIDALKNKYSQGGLSSSAQVKDNLVTKTQTSETGSSSKAIDSGSTTTSNTQEASAATGSNQKTESFTIDVAPSTPNAEVNNATASKSTSVDTLSETETPSASKESTIPATGTPITTSATTDADTKAGSATLVEANTIVATESESNQVSNGTTTAESTTLASEATSPATADATTSSDSSSETFSEEITDAIPAKDPDLTKTVAEIREDKANQNITSMEEVEEVETDDLDFGAAEIEDAHTTSEEAYNEETIPSLKEGAEDSYGETDQPFGIDEVEEDPKKITLTNTDDLIPEYKQSVSYNQSDSDESDQARK